MGPLLHDYDSYKITCTISHTWTADLQQTTPELFTGPSIRRITSEGLYDLEKLQKEWRVFVIKNRPFKGELNLKTGSFVLHEVRNVLISVTH